MNGVKLKLIDIQDGLKKKIFGVDCKIYLKSNLSKFITLLHAETKSLMTEIGPEVVNRDKITVSFVCKPITQT